MGKGKKTQLHFTDFASSKVFCALLLRYFRRLFFVGKYIIFVIHRPYVNMLVLCI